MSADFRIPSPLGLIGAVACSFVVAIEFGLGIHLRPLSLNLALGFAGLLIVAFAALRCRPYGLLALLAVPLAIVVATNSSWQVGVACAVKGLCP